MTQLNTYVWQLAERTGLPDDEEEDAKVLDEENQVGETPMTSEEEPEVEATEAKKAE